ncbi:MAG: YfcE family phosphodiesterase [Gammaproteobacteria bacterium]|nr:YfcE family phosphodiesterase [Gammaproteobacteria bacterium]MBT8435923.1 YfcE family phosphodiesterase [Gammaproteobacteria bacterium]
MTTRIGLISDVHSSPEPLAQALEIFREERVDEIICAGDIAGYYDTLLPTIELLAASGCKAIVGNHDQSYLEKERPQDDPSIRAYLQNLPEFLDLEIEQKRLFVVHANPPCEQHGGIKLLDQQGAIKGDRKNQWTLALSEFDYDVLIVGHTHQVYAEQLGRVLVVNPGSSVFNHSCMILSLPDMDLETFALGEREIVKCWNFGMLYS